MFGNHCKFKACIKEKRHASMQVDLIEQGSATYSPKASYGQQQSPQKLIEQLEVCGSYILVGPVPLTASCLLTHPP